MDRELAVEPDRACHFHLTRQAFLVPESDVRGVDRAHAGGDCAGDYGAARVSQGRACRIVAGPMPRGGRRSPVTQVPRYSGVVRVVLGAETDCGDSWRSVADVVGGDNSTRRFDPRVECDRARLKPVSAFRCGDCGGDPPHISGAADLADRYPGDQCPHHRLKVFIKEAGVERIKAGYHRDPRTCELLKIRCDLTTCDRLLAPRHGVFHVRHQGVRRRVGGLLKHVRPVAGHEKEASGNWRHESHTPGTIGGAGLAGTAIMIHSIRRARRAHK